MDREYTKEQWEQERELTLRDTPVKCPNPKCDKLRAYWTYTQKAVPMYCMCKFCGFWQAVGEKPKRCNMFYHECPLPNPRKGYDWNANDSCACQTCGQILTNKVKWPVDDPDHPFRKL